MKQKASIAVSLIHDPEVIIFDEPTTGLDIVTARSVTDYLKLMKDQGKTVIISTHIMTEAEKLCDKIGIIIKGQLTLEGSLEEILTETNTKDLEDAFLSSINNIIRRRHRMEGTKILLKRTNQSFYR